MADRTEKVFYIDLEGISNKESLYRLIAEELSLPDYFGNNLDAFYDILTDEGGSWNLIFYNQSKTGPDISDYLGRLRKMCRDAVKETEGLKIRFYD